ncbi:MAG TPA: DNA-3-methyladenine glycosylase [Candidatus Paceibacterota bacterium]|nr:DNA-3-methyladenine glycosylase [Candidatus Paceibacterota bacterium]
MKRKILSKSFFDRPTLVVARELLGKYIARRNGIALMITEVEAYDGPLDLASHARRGITPRTKVMFGPAGVFYVYFTYGMHWMVNIVTGPKDYPAAILIRAGIKEDGTPVTGPARLTKYLNINKEQNGKCAGKTTGLWFEDRSVRVARSKIIASKRIGVEYAGRVWAGKPYNLKIAP